ncbi:MAG: hypothetical protein ACW98D_17485 [Promethearchaeota archaeon]|jgi:hypothetical protein
MKKNHKIILFSVLGLGAVVGAYFYFKKGKDEALLREDSSEEEVEEDIPTTVSPKFPLSKGSRGSEVVVLQQYLNRSPMCKGKMPKSTPNSRVRKILPLDEDGIFGVLTLGALQMCYESDSVDEKLWKRMNDALPSLSV